MAGAAPDPGICPLFAGSLLFTKCPGGNIHEPVRSCPHGHTQRVSLLVFHAPLTLLVARAPGEQPEKVG